ncbi:unnamed protein product [Pylaiella littoralis]
MLVEYSHEKGEIDIKVYGNIATTAPWAALSLGISACRVMCSDFPGLRWLTFLKRPRHKLDMQVSKTATRPGDKLLLEHGCSLCSSETGGVGAAATEVLQSRGMPRVNLVSEMFREVHGRFVDLQQQYPVLRPENSGGFHPEQARRRFEGWLTGIREEAAGLLHGGGQGVEESARAREPEDVSISDEVGKLQRLVGDLQQQLGQHDQDVRGWLGAVDRRLEAIIDADTGAMKKQHFLVAMLMAMRSEGFDTPRQACVLPPWKFAQTYGLSEHEQTPEVWVKRLDEWREDDFKQGKGVIRKKKHLFLLCAHTHQLAPCGPKGQGYDVQQLRTWVRKSVSGTAFALQVACSTLAAGGVEATVSEALGSLQSKLEGLTLDEDKGVNTDHQTANLEDNAYASLREFIHRVEDDARVEIFKVKKKAHKERRALPSSSEFVFFADKMTQVQRHDGDATVQWVLKGQEDAWGDAKMSAPKA